MASALHTRKPMSTALFRSLLVLSLASTASIAQVIPGTLGQAAVYNSNGTSLTSSPISIDVSQLSGVDAGAKINACVAALPAQGGTCDARGIQGWQSTANTIVLNKPMLLLLSPSLNLVANPSVAPVIQFGSHVTIKSDVADGGSVTTAKIETQNPAASLLAPVNPSVNTNAPTVYGISLYNASTATTAPVIDFTDVNHGTIERTSIGHAGGPGSGIYVYGGEAEGAPSDVYGYFENNDLYTPGGDSYFLGAGAYIFTILGGSSRQSADCVHIDAPAQAGIDGGDIIGLNCISYSGYALNVVENTGHVHWVAGRMESNVSTGLINMGTNRVVDITIYSPAVEGVQVYGNDQGVVTWYGYFNAYSSSYPVNIMPGAHQVNSMSIPATTSSSQGVINLGSNSFIQAYGQGQTFIGQESGNFTMSGTYNSGLGYATLYATTTGNYNAVLGSEGLSANTSGSQNSAVGAFSLIGNTSGSDNTALGYLAGVTATSANQNVSGSQNTWVGSQAGPSSATQLTNSTAIGYKATSTASNQVTLGNNAVTQTVLYGTEYRAGATPIASAGAITGTNDGGYVSGLSSVNSLTITFANGGWSRWASCVANANVKGQAPSVSAISNSTVTFTLPSAANTLYYHCDGF